MDIQKLIDAKKQKHITFDELADITQLSISTLKDIFRGKTTSPRIDTIEMIEKALGINKTSINHIDDIPVAIYDASKGLSDEDVEDVLKYIEFVKSKKE